MTNNEIKNPSINLNDAELKILVEDALKSLEPFEVRDIVARMQETIKLQQAEIERLKEELALKGLKYTLLERDRAEDICDFVEELKTIKAEAIKEFAEKLCEGRVPNDPVVIAVNTELKMAGDA